MNHSFYTVLGLDIINLVDVFLFRSEKRKRLMNSDTDLTEDYPKENDSSR